MTHLPQGVGRAPTCLYRHFAADGSLLYVGISLSWPMRTKAHANGSAWFNDVASVTIERFESREAAIEAERKAIKSERPKFNVVHNRPDKPERRSRVFHGKSGGASAGADPARFLSSKERRRLEERKPPLLRTIKGPHAIVGPALVYRGETVSVLVAHGRFGAPGEITELVLGELMPETPDWTHICDTVLVIRGMNEITLSEAREERDQIARTLRNHLESVQVVDSDLALAAAYATQFPSAEARALLDAVASESRP